MFKKIRFYIFIRFFKYLISLIFLFFGLIWLSQILRLIDIRFSISNQLYDVFSASLFVLPSYLNPLLPILLIFNYLLFNYELISSNEIKIINQYVSKKFKLFFQINLSFIILFIFTLNNEILSPLTYKVYKERELEIRNSLKLGVPINNEFHIGNDLIIFFKEGQKNIFYKIEAIIFESNEFILSDSLKIEYTNDGFNIVFINGYRVKMNKFEKSKTTFRKFIYNLKNKSPDKLLYDKEHFNTIQLLNMEKIDFKIQGHSRVINYFLLILTLIISNTLIFKNFRTNKENFSSFMVILLIIMVYIANSYFQYLLTLNKIETFTYYISSVIIGLIFALILKFRFQ